MSDIILRVEIRFTQAARRHRIGRASARYVMARAIPAGTRTEQGNRGWRYVGLDDRGRELEIVAVEVEGDQGAFLLVIHVMPTRFRGRGSHA